MLLPPVRGVIDRRHDAAGTALFLVGAVGGGLAVAAALFVVAGLTGALPSPALAVLLSATVALLATVESGRVRNRLGGRQEPIPQARFRRSMLRGQLAFGAELGLGFRTRITHMGPYLLVAVLLLGRVDAPGFALVAVGWGLGRGSAFVVRLLQRPVVGDLDAGQQEGADSTGRFHAIMGLAGVWATQLLFGGVMALAVHQLADAV